MTYREVLKLVVFGSFSVQFVLTRALASTQALSHLVCDVYPYMILLTWHCNILILTTAFVDNMETIRLRILVMGLQLVVNVG